jgi:hypothetical protein
MLQIVTELDGFDSRGNIKVRFTNTLGAGRTPLAVTIGAWYHVSSSFVQGSSVWIRDLT